MDGRGIVAAMALGASAAQMGTAFLALRGKRRGPMPTRMQSSSRTNMKRESLALSPAALRGESRIVS